MKQKLAERIEAFLKDQGGRYTYDDLAKKLKAGPSGVYKALKALHEQKRVISYEIQGKTWWELPSPATAIWKMRIEGHRVAKQKVSMRTFELVVGASNKDSTAEQVETTRTGLLAELPPHLQSVLRSVYSHRERAVIIDGGTTNYLVAETLKSISLPSERLGVWRFLVFTNCPPIAECLSEAPTGPAVTLIGGRVSRRTHSISGHFAEMSIAAWNIMADFSIIGATGVDLRRGFCSYSEEEGVVKTMLLSRSRVKCIVMDSSKVIESGAGQVTFSFAPVSKDTVDLLISDEGIKEHRAFCDELTSRGVGILA